MSKPQFEQFQRELLEYNPEKEIIYTHSHFVRHALRSLYPDRKTELPFDDEVISIGHANDWIDLKFRSNAKLD